MSLLMYRNGVLSADRRVNQITISGDDFDGLEHYPKIWLAPDRSILIGSVGFIPTNNDRSKISAIFEVLSKDENWMIKIPECKALLDMMRNGNVFFVFLKGVFVIIRRLHDELEYEECDLTCPRFCGSGWTAASVLVRSRKEFTLPQFYRIVAACCESVSTVFDQIPVHQVKGFKK